MKPAYANSLPDHGGDAHRRVCVTESALIRSRLRASPGKFFAKVDYRKTIGPAPPHQIEDLGRDKDLKRRILFAVFYSLQGLWIAKIKVQLIDYNNKNVLFVGILMFRKDPVDHEGTPKMLLCQIVKSNG
ncbi:hypothetical protein ACE1OG_15600 [Aeromonas hydrophila]|uniref:hypothetical protein n=1 Tax=Aeromonas hydrophila TaxID=644 RepID=UPI0022AEE9CB|nr:hypothetical protein [Aeromonas hydrophila]ELB2790469.1 hypothetical protein [Aeromonas hydrophila]MCZ4332267.1 hypothetical protein [Aeromonas hydrophila]